MSVCIIGISSQAANVAGLLPDSDVAESSTPAQSVAASDTDLPIHAAITDLSDSAFQPVCTAQLSATITNSQKMLLPHYEYTKTLLAHIACLVEASPFTFSFLLSVNISLYLYSMVRGHCVI